MSNDKHPALHFGSDINAPVLDDLFLVDVIHKIKNGLGGIEGFAALLERDLEPEDPRRRLAQRVQEGVRKVNDVSVAAMLLARPTDLAKEPVRIGAFTRQVLDNLIPLSAESQIDIQIDDTVAKREIDADPRHLQRLFQYVLKLIGRIEGQLQSAWLGITRQNHVEISFRFASEPLMEQWPTSLESWMAELHPVEARLALGVALKIARSHDINFTLCILDETPCIALQLT